MKTTVFAIIGGDQRSIFCANFLSNKGARVRAFGFDNYEGFSKEILQPESLDSALKGADCILLPLPIAAEKGILNTPLYQKVLYLDELPEAITKNQVVFAGKPDEDFISALEKKGITCHDYTKREEFSVLNAIPTAEGALQIAMEKLPITLHDSNCLVIGFGRIAKLLCHDLSSLGAHVSAAARKERDLAFMQAFGYTPIHTKDIKEHLSRFNLIINTVPAMMLPDDMLAQVNKEALIIDLASRPGGIDFESAERLGLETTWALSLPGKVAPRTAADIICKTILNILTDSEVKA